MAAIQAFLSAEFLGAAIWLWLAFIAVVTALLAFDLGVLHRNERPIEVRESLWLSAAYITAGLAFGAWVWWQLGSQSGIDYVTGFIVEKTLAMDNVFVIAMIFTFFAIPPQYQHRVLFWGVLGVIVLRAIVIGLGAAIVTEFSWVLYVFGAFLVATGVKLLLFAGKKFDLEANPLLKFLRARLRVTDRLHGNRFWVRLPAAGEGASGPLAWWATPLFLALVLIELVDLVFAVDSLPAIFAITQEPFVVYTSNIFAILGLRALYFALAAMIERFAYLKYALALVLIFIGGKIFAVNTIGKMPPALSLAITSALLLGGIVYSLHRTRQGLGPVHRSAVHE